MKIDENLKKNRLGILNKKRLRYLKYDKIFIRIKLFF